MLNEVLLKLFVLLYFIWFNTPFSFPYILSSQCSHFPKKLVFFTSKMVKKFFYFMLKALLAFEVFMFLS